MKNGEELTEREDAILKELTEEEKSILKVMYREEGHPFEEIIKRTGFKPEIVSFLLDVLIAKGLIDEKDFREK